MGKQSWITLVVTERMRQIRQKEWQDGSNDDGGLAVVAATLAVEGTDAVVVDPHGRGTPMPDENGDYRENDALGLVAKYGHKAQPGGAIKRLAVAGALLAAEIDRLLKLEEKDADSEF